MCPPVPDHPMDQARRAVILDQLADYLEPFLGWLQPVRGRSPYTIDVFRKDLRQFLAFVDTGDRRRPEHVDHRLIEAYLGWLQSPAGWRKRAPQRNTSRPPSRSVSMP